MSAAFVVGIISFTNLHLPESVLIVAQMAMGENPSRTPSEHPTQPNH